MAPGPYQGNLDEDPFEAVTVKDQVLRTVVVATQ